jgi:hypothetical protein
MSSLDNTNDDEFLFIPLVDVETLPWYPDLKEYTSSVERMDQILSILQPLILDYMPRVDDYLRKENRNKVQRCILEGMPSTDKEIIEQTNALKGKRNKTPEEKELMKQRNNIKTKIRSRYYNLGIKFYPDNVERFPQPSPRRGRRSSVGSAGSAVSSTRRLSTPRVENDDIYTGVDYEDEDEEEQNVTLTNYLNLIPENQRPVVRNPYIEKHNIQLPFRMIDVGGSGSGKTNAIHDLIAKMNPLDEDGQEEEDPTFDQILVFTQCEEPHYELLSQRPRVFVGYGVGSIPSLEDDNVFLPNNQYLVVFDDMILEKDQEVIKSYYQRG